MASLLFTVVAKSKCNASFEMQARNHLQFIKSFAKAPKRPGYYYWQENQIWCYQYI